jgi:phosphoheptose isomerase
MDQSTHPDLGFRWRRNKRGEVQIHHHGTLAATLRGGKAADFVAEVEGGSEADAQHSMARVTGNYKRGNERLARNHLRNRRFTP